MRKKQENRNRELRETLSQKSNLKTLSLCNLSFYWMIRHCRWAFIWTVGLTSLCWALWAYLAWIYFWIDGLASVTQIGPMDPFSQDTCYLPRLAFFCFFFQPVTSFLNLFNINEKNNGKIFGTNVSNLGRIKIACLLGGVSFMSIGMTKHR